MTEHPAYSNPAWVLTTWGLLDATADPRQNAQAICDKIESVKDLIASKSPEQLELDAILACYGIWTLSRNEQRLLLERFERMAESGACSVECANTLRGVVKSIGAAAESRRPTDLGGTDA